MHPGEILPGSEAIEINVDRKRATVTVHNASRWCVQVASHVHFFEVNRKLRFNRSSAFGMHLDIPAGRAVRWEPAETKTVDLVAYGGEQTVIGFNGLCDGPASAVRLPACLDLARARGFVSEDD